MLILRDMIQSDIEDYVNWFTKELEWGDWDAPWEPFETSEEEERRNWTEYFNSVKDRSKDDVRWRFEIECDGVHIGWVSAYTDLGYLENHGDIPAVGINIPNMQYRKNGNGTKALELFINYWAKQGYKSLYTQTWSGNYPMIKVAEKLGFKEVYRKRDYRDVDGKKYDAVTFRLDM